MSGTPGGAARLPQVRRHGGRPDDVRDYAGQLGGGMETFPAAGPVAALDRRQSPGVGRTPTAETPTGQAGRDTQCQSAGPRSAHHGVRVTDPLTLEDVVSLQRSLTTTISRSQSVHGIATVLNATIGGTVVIDDGDGLRLAQAGGDGGEDLLLPDWRRITSTEHARAVRLGEWVVVVARPEGSCLGVIGLLDPDGLGEETDFLALEQGAMVLATEMFRLRSVASDDPGMG